MGLDGESTAVAQDIQNAGVIVGKSGGRAAFWWNGASGWEVGELPVPVTPPYSFVQAVNNATKPQVVGSYSDGTGGSGHLCVWEIDIDGGTVRMAYDAGAQTGSGYGINDAGELCWLASDGSHASWSEDPLPSLGGPDTGALDINNAGEVVGWAELPRDYAHACLWRSGSGPVDLGTIGGKYKCSMAQAINETGQVVGWSHLAGSPGIGQAPSTDPQPTLWTDGQIIDLNEVLTAPIGALLRRAWDINDDDCIVGLAKVDDGSVYGLSRPFLLVPAGSGPNQAPVAEDDSYSVVENGVLSVDAPGVLANDSDPNGDDIEVRSSTEPANGDVTLNPDGSFTYTPTAGFTGTDSFTYTAWDLELESNTATVTITVGGPQEPGAITGIVSDASGSVKKATVTAKLNDVEVASTPTNPKGKYTLSGLESGDYLVEPAKDGAEGSAPATVLSDQTTTGIDITIQ